MVRKQPECFEKVVRAIASPLAGFITGAALDIGGPAPSIRSNGWQVTKTGPVFVFDRETGEPV